MKRCGNSRLLSQALCLVACATLLLGVLLDASHAVAAASTARAAVAATRYAGWVMDAYPGDTTAYLKAQMQRQISAGANVVWLGHDNPGEVGYNKREPGLAFSVWLAYHDPTAVRHGAAVAMVQAQQHALDAARSLHVPAVLSIGYQTQMGTTWNLAHPQDARRLADGSSYDGPQPINIDAAFQSPDYQHDIAIYYRWIDATFVRPYSRTILMLNLADEPQGGDYSTWADAAFRATHGYGLRQAGSDPRRQEAVGRFESDYIVDYAAWSAQLWLSIDRAVSVTISFDGGYERYRYEGPDLEDIFRAAPANFVVTFDAYPRDGLFTTPLHDSDLIELFNLVRTLGYYSAAYHRPLWLWSAANSWGLNEASSDPGNIADAVANAIYLAQLARQTGGDLQGVAAWNYNIKGQGLFNDTHHLSYDPNQMFARLSATFGSLRAIMSAPAGQPDTAVLAPNAAELRAAGAQLLLRAHDPYHWAALAALARTNVAAVIVTGLNLPTLPALRTVLVLARTPSDLSPVDTGALSTLLTRGGTVLAGAAVARALADPSASMQTAITISATPAIMVRRLHTTAGTLLAVDGAPVEELFADAHAAQAAQLWREVLQRPVLTTGYMVAAGGVTLLYSIAPAGSHITLDAPGGAGSTSLSSYDTHGAIQRTIPMVSGRGPVHVFIARRSYALAPALATLSLAASPGDAALTTNTMPAAPAANPTDHAPPLPGAQYFKDYGHNLSGPFLTFWKAHGGKDLFGTPRSEVFKMSNGHQAQYFDRVLLELTGGKIQIDPLGVWLNKGNPDPAFKRVTKCLGTLDKYVAQTGHCIPYGRFLTYWQAHRALLGAPISEVTTAQNGDGTGKTYALQWFENGRLEYHSENDTAAKRKLFGDRYVMELGFVGREWLRKIGWLAPAKTP